MSECRSNSPSRRGGPGAEQAAYGYGQLQTILAAQPTQKDVFAAPAASQAAQSVRRPGGQQQQSNQQFQQQQTLQQQGFQQQSTMQDRHAELQTQLSQAPALSPGRDVAGCERLQNATDYVDERPVAGGRREERTCKLADPHRDWTRSRRGSSADADAGLGAFQLQQLAAAAGSVGGDGHRRGFSTRSRRRGCGVIHSWTPRLRSGTARTNSWQPALASSIQGHGRVRPVQGCSRDSAKRAQQQPRSQEETSAAARRGTDRRYEDDRRQQQEDTQRRREEQHRIAQEQRRQQQLGTALDHAEGSVRGEVQHCRRPRGRLRPIRAESARRRTSSREELNRQGGTDAKMSDLTAEDMNQLVGSEAQSRVQRTHSHLLQGDGQRPPGNAAPQGGQPEQATAAPFRSAEPSTQSPAQREAVGNFVRIRRNMATARTHPDGTPMTAEWRQTGSRSGDRRLAAAA